MLDVRSLLTNPDPQNPYKFDGVNYAPAVLNRVMRTPADVVSVIAEAKVVHDVTDEQILERTGIDPEALRAATQEGLCSLPNLLCVLEAVGVNPVVLPYPTDGMR